MFTQPEWAEAFSGDPTGNMRKLLPVRVRECKPAGLLAPIEYVDLFDLSEQEAESTLLTALLDRAKPSNRPTFPGGAVPPRVFAGRVPFPNSDIQSPQPHRFSPNPPHADPMFGYSVIKTVYTGGYGRVMKCLRHDGSVCIVKATDSQEVSIEALSRLTDLPVTNIAKPLRIWSVGDYVYEELPYVAGIRLSDMIFSGHGGLQGALLESFAVSTKRSLAGLHAQGIVHRDIHPDNVYAVFRSTNDKQDEGWTYDAFGSFDRDFNPTTPFEIAWVIVDCTFVTLDQDIQAKAYYHGRFTPPEQVFGHAEAASDMYALGATMFYAALGRYIPSYTEPSSCPFKRDDYVQPPYLQDYIERLLSRSPATRPKAVDEIKYTTAAVCYTGLLRAPHDNIVICSTSEIQCELVPISYARTHTKDYYLSDKWRSLVS